MAKRATKYKLSLVSFFDILGFGEIVKTKSPGEISDLLDLFRTCSRPDPRAARHLQIKFANFSDCVIRTVNLQSKPNREFPYGLLFLEILSLLHMQIEIVSAGYLVRGALTLGEAHATAGRVFGPGIVTAYKLESELAIYPRIIIDPATLAFDTPEKIRLLKSAQHDIELEREYLGSLLRRDSDGVWFIDYLRASQSEFDGGAPAYIDFILDHKNLVENGLKQFKNLNRVVGKYLWLANYHNTTVETFAEEALEEFDVEKDELRVDADLLVDLG